MFTKSSLILTLLVLSVCTIKAQTIPKKPIKTSKVVLFNPKENALQIYKLLMEKDSMIYVDQINHNNINRKKIEQKQLEISYYKQQRLKAFKLK